MGSGSRDHLRNRNQPCERQAAERCGDGRYKAAAGKTFHGASLVKEPLTKRVLISKTLRWSIEKGERNRSPSPAA